MPLLSFILVLLAGVLQPVGGAAVTDLGGSQSLLQAISNTSALAEASAASFEQPAQDPFGGLILYVESGQEEVESHNSGDNDKSWASGAEVNIHDYLLQNSARVLLKKRFGYRSDLPKFILFQVFRI